jgi:secreted PhoX family phosphatase
VWECDPQGVRPARVLPAMGVLRHEGAAVDPVGRRVYLTEDEPDGALYRYTPRRWPQLASGRLEVALVGHDRRVDWRRVPDPLARSHPTRYQVRGTSRFARGEGMWRDGRFVYIATTVDHRVHVYDTVRERLQILYDADRLPTRRWPRLIR